MCQTLALENCSSRCVAIKKNKKNKVLTDFYTLYMIPGFQATMEDSFR